MAVIVSCHAAVLCSAWTEKLPVAGIARIYLAVFRTPCRVTVSPINASSPWCFSKHRCSFDYRTMQLELYWMRWPAWLSFFLSFVISAPRASSHVIFLFNPAIRTLATRETVIGEKETKTERRQTHRGKMTIEPCIFQRLWLDLPKRQWGRGSEGTAVLGWQTKKKAICHWCFWADDAVCGLNRECTQQVGLIRQKAEQESCWLLFESCQYVCIWRASFIWKCLMAKRCTTSDSYCMV